MTNSEKIAPVIRETLPQNVLLYSERLHEPSPFEAQYLAAEREALEEFFVIQKMLSEREAQTQ